MRIIPIIVYNTKGNILIRWPCVKPYYACLAIVAILVLLKSVSWNHCIINKVWIKDVKFIALNKLWRWVVMIIVSPIVFVPHISSVNTVCIFWLFFSALVMRLRCKAQREEEAEARARTRAQKDCSEPEREEEEDRSTLIAVVKE